jgi:peptidyl-prolyl cis-trans isomerase SurA
MKVGKVIPSSPKALSEARGYIVADYQDHLEQQWVESLRKAYEVKINQSIFDKLVRK